jgi:hypothetical protein
LEQRRACLLDGTCKDQLFLLEDWEWKNAKSSAHGSQSTASYQSPAQLTTKAEGSSTDRDQPLVRSLSGGKRRGRLDLHFNGRLKGRPLPAELSEAAKLQASAHSICWSICSICTPVMHFNHK